MSDKRATETLRADEAGIARAAQMLRDGGLVAVPTETVYGLAARADSADAVAQIYAAKGRPDFNPLIVHVQGVEQAERYALFDSRARRLCAAFWPGPLTVVLPMAENTNLARAVTAGLPTVALRSPAHPVMQQLLQAIDFPLAAPSANRSGSISPTKPEHVLASLGGRIDAVMDDGECPQGVESTIVALRPAGWQILRPGPVTLNELVELLGKPADVTTSAIEAPGQLASHYAPGKPMRLNVTEPRAGEFMIGFGAVVGACTLSASGDLSEAAARLYDCLHQAAQSDEPLIAVAPVADTGIGVAINDRLRRAAA